MIGYCKYEDTTCGGPTAHIFIDMIANETETEFLCDGESISLNDITKHTDDAPPIFPCCDCQTVAASIAADKAALTEDKE